MTTTAATRTPMLEGTTQEDFNKTTSRILRGLDPVDPTDDHAMPEARAEESRDRENASRMGVGTAAPPIDSLHVIRDARSTQQADFTPTHSASFLQKVLKWIKIYGRFIGPGFMISVAYIDPGNYSTDVLAGASYQFKLLFIVLVSSLIAVYLQSLCIKLGTITGMDLAQMCRAHLPRWLNIFLYLMAEGAIIATDIAEVIGTAIAINILVPQISLVAGCGISILDVFVTLMFYHPNGTMKGVRGFEFFVAALVLSVVFCFCIELSLIKNTSVGEVFRGYLPSSAIVEPSGIYQACGILGATVMPHSLYLGSGIVQPRLIEYDEKHGHRIPASLAAQTSHPAEGKPFYQPSLAAINHCMKYSIIELAISLSTFALFVNSAILIVAGASLYGNGMDDAQDPSLFSIYDLLVSSIGPAAGTLFVLALLLSGMSAGIVCTIAGQMVSEGALNWTISPWLRRLITRSIAITPSIIIAGAVGKEGLDAALNGSQVALSVALPFISAPLIYFTARNKYMTVNNNRKAAIVEGSVNDGELERLLGAEQPVDEGTKMRNHWAVTAFAVLLWLLVAVMSVGNLVLLGLDH